MMRWRQNHRRIKMKSKKVTKTVACARHDPQVSVRSKALLCNPLAFQRNEPQFDSSTMDPGFFWRSDDERGTSNTVESDTLSAFMMMMMMMMITMCLEETVLPFSTKATRKRTTKDFIPMMVLLVIKLMPILLLQMMRKPERR